MNKLIFSPLLFLLLTTPIHSMKPTTLFTASNRLLWLLIEHSKSTTQKLLHWEGIQSVDPRVKNHVLKTMHFTTDYIDYGSKVELLVATGGDPKAPEQPPLALALHHKDVEFAIFLLKNCADPNQEVRTRPIDINTHQETGSSANFNHQETGSSVNFSQWNGKPAFYFAPTIKLAQLCLIWGARVDLTYNNHEHDYGNVLTHVFDNANYAADLTHHYLNSGAGPYHKSYESRDGSALHHLMRLLC